MNELGNSWLLLSIRRVIIPSLKNFSLATLDEKSNTFHYCFRLTKLSGQCLNEFDNTKFYLSSSISQVIKPAQLKYYHAALAV